MSLEEDELVRLRALVLQLRSETGPLVRHKCAAKVHADWWTLEAYGLKHNCPWCGMGLLHQKLDTIRKEIRR